MILTCPQCDTRYQADEAKFPPEGRNVRCAKCGNVWHQSPPLVPAASEAGAAVSEEIVSDTSLPHANDSLRTLGPSAVARGPRASWLGKVAIVAGWLGLIAVILLIGLSAVRYRQEIATSWPQTSSFYSALGMSVRGLDFRDLNSSRRTEDGQVVLSVSGIIFNNASRELPVPQTIRVILSDENNREVYRWSFAPAIATLKPRQSVKFVTRLSNPPANARHLEVRFVKDGS